MFKAFKHHGLKLDNESWCLEVIFVVVFHLGDHHSLLVNMQAPWAFLSLFWGGMNGWIGGLDRGSLSTSLSFHTLTLAVYPLSIVLSFVWLLSIISIRFLFAMSYEKKGLEMPKCWCSKTKKEIKNMYPWLKCNKVARDEYKIKIQEFELYPLMWGHHYSPMHIMLIKVKGT